MTDSKEMEIEHARQGVLKMLLARRMHVLTGDKEKEIKYSKISETLQSPRIKGHLIDADKSDALIDNGYLSKEDAIVAAIAALEETKMIKKLDSNPPRYTITEYALQEMGIKPLWAEGARRMGIRPPKGRE